ncbi:hypothetical protein IJ096_00230 [Candidatus Saccharibacteria bacterium]|nr:hypothetical protein [Candidatus Saccharibacteria bacterium]
MTKEKAAENSFSLKYKTVNWQVISGVALGVSLVAGTAFFFHPFVSETSYATNSNVSVGYSGSDWVITAPTSTAADAGGLTFDIEGNPAGVNMAKKDTVTGGGTNVPDYQIYVSVDTEGGKIPATSGDAAIAATSGTVTDATTDVSGAAALSNNSWGFALPSFNTGINYDDLVSSSSSSSWASSKWSKLPYVATASVEDESTVESTATKIYDSTTSTTDSVDVYYAVNANNDLASGEYQTTVTYTLIGEMPTSPVAYMQDATYADWCANIETTTSASDVHTYTLYDKRTEEPYYIRKFSDGNCWMVENLYLPGSLTLTPDDSNVTNNYTLPTSSTTGFGSSTVPYMYAGGTNVSEARHRYNATYDGSYFNFPAARAIDNPYTEGAPVTSVCPKNWRLFDNTEGSTVSTALNSIANAQVFYSDINGNIANPILAGFYDTNNLINAGSSSHWYSLYYYSDYFGNAFSLLYSGSRFSTVGQIVGGSSQYCNPGIYGLSIRCILSNNNNPSTYYHYSSPIDY